MKDFTFPSITVWEKETYKKNYGKFIIEPLERGYGVTLGNTLRRVLLSSVSGIAITSFRIDGIMHEFSTIDGVKEDAVEIAMNLKQVVLEANISDFPHHISLDLAGKTGKGGTGDLSLEDSSLSTRTVNILKAAGIDNLQKLISKTKKELLNTESLGQKSVEEIEKVIAKKGLSLKDEGATGEEEPAAEAGQFEVTAKDLINDGSADVVNGELHIATVRSDKALKLDIELTEGRGYLPLHKMKVLREDVPLGTILLDGIYSPVKKVSFNVENTRVGQFVDYERVILELWTNGAVSPDEALDEATRILNSHYTIIAENQKIGGDEDLPEQEGSEKPDLEVPIEELKLSTRVCNALKLKDVTTLGELLQTPKESFSEIKNLGKKSVEEIEEALQKRGLSLKTDKELSEEKQD